MFISFYGVLAPSPEDPKNYQTPAVVALVSWSIFVPHRFLLELYVQSPCECLLLQEAWVPSLLQALVLMA